MNKLENFKTKLNLNLDLNLDSNLNLKDYIKINDKKILDFKNENKENLENFNKLIELDYFIENKIDIKENKEKRKNLINENLNNKLFNIYNLQKFINYLDKNDKRIVNDKKYINKLWIDLNLQDKSIYESIINYFILLYLDKDYFLNIDLLNKKLKNSLSKKELKELNELNTFSFKELKSNFLENFNNKYILDYINEYENFKSKNNLKDIDLLLNEKNENIENYKFKLLLIKNNSKDIKNLKEFKNKYYKEYKLKSDKTQKKIKRYSLKLKENYINFYNEYINNNIIDYKKLKKLIYKNKINIYKYKLFKDSKLDYKDFINSKNIRYLNYLNKNLDLDLDLDKKYKSLNLVLDYKLKSK